MTHRHLFSLLKHPPSLNHHIQTYNQAHRLTDTHTRTHKHTHTHTHIQTQTHTSRARLCLVVLHVTLSLCYDYSFQGPSIHCDRAHYGGGGFCMELAQLELRVDAGGSCWLLIGTWPLLKMSSICFFFKGIHCRWGLGGERETCLWLKDNCHIYLYSRHNRTQVFIRIVAIATTDMDNGNKVLNAQ